LGTIAFDAAGGGFHELKRFVLPYPIGLEANWEHLHVERVPEEGTQSRKCNVEVVRKSWKETLSAAESDYQGRTPSQEEDIAKCVARTDIFMNDDRQYTQRHEFMYRGNQGRGHEKNINVVFLFHGLNQFNMDVPVVGTVFKRQDNGVNQMMVWYADMCTHLVRQEQEFLLVLVGTSYLDMPEVRALYLDLGVLYTHQYMRQAWVYPLLRELDDQGYKQKILFAGFSMGGILATFSAISTLSGKASEKLGVENLVLDPFRDIYTDCPKQSVKELRNAPNDGSAPEDTSNTDSMLNIHLEKLEKCIRLQGGSPGVTPPDVPRYFNEEKEKSMAIDNVYVAGLVTFGTPLHQFVPLDRFCSNWAGIRFLKCAKSLDNRTVLTTELKHEKEKTGSIKGRHILGRIIATDGQVLGERTRDDSAEKLRVWHFNHIDDGVVGYQGDGKAAEKVGFMGYGWGDANTTGPTEDHSVFAPFTCFFAEHPNVDPKNADAIKNKFDVPYAYHQMIVTNNPTDAEATANHGSIIGSDSHDFRDFKEFNRHARIHVMMRPVINSVFPPVNNNKSPPRALCTKENRYVQVKIKHWLTELGKGYQPPRFTIGYELQALPVSKFEGHVLHMDGDTIEKRMKGEDPQPRLIEKTAKNGVPCIAYKGIPAVCGYHDHDSTWCYTSRSSDGWDHCDTQSGFPFPLTDANDTPK